jgi:hypothetical protein
MNPINRKTASFLSKEMEELYRSEYLSVDKLKTISGFVLLTITGLIFIKSDYLLFGTSETFWNLCIARITSIFLVVIATAFIIKSRNYKIIDRLTLLSLIIISLLMLYVNFTRPLSYFQNTIIDFIVLLSFYVFIPNRLIFQIVPGIVLSSFTIYIIVFYRELNTLGYLVFWVSQFFVNFIGIWASWHMHMYRREHFKTMSERSVIKHQLEDSLKEIETLKDCLPICSHCKSMKNYYEYWEKLEEYLEKNSGQVSSGMCPDCIQKTNKE